MQDQTFVLTRLVILFSVTFPRQNWYFWCDLFYCELISAHTNESLKLAGQNNETVTYSECFQQLPKCSVTRIPAGNMSFTKTSWIWLAYVIIT